ncbi:hypothetical protein MMC14_006473 [Varicellaria rhodocarpa]|nr:hypothetical protein [Varicellaria rhodocarpa]
MSHTSTFVGNGKFAGEIYWDCFGTFKLMGKMDMEKSRITVLSNKVPQWKSAYRVLEQDNWDRECAEHWRQYHNGKKSRRDRTPNSDTDGGFEKDSEEEEWDDDDEGSRTHQATP